MLHFHGHIETNEMVKGLKKKEGGNEPIIGKEPKPLFGMPVCIFIIICIWSRFPAPKCIPENDPPFMLLLSKPPNPEPRFRDCCAPLPPASPPAFDCDSSREVTPATVAVTSPSDHFWTASCVFVASPSDASGAFSLKICWWNLY